MQKIPTIFLRDENNRKYVTEEVNPVCQWVIDGEGVATRKYDGTCVMFDGASWWARRSVNKGKTKPSGFVDVSFDSVTGKTIGWEPIANSPFFNMFVDANSEWFSTPNGTYELCGPKINGNPENYVRHVLIQHENAQHVYVPENITWYTIRDEMIKLCISGVEGIVWHHPDGRMAKIKVRDFDLTEMGK